MYPVALHVRGRRAVVVGGGGVAERKVRGLLDGGAAVTLIAPEVSPALAALAAAGTIAWESRRYAPGDLRGALLAFAATNDDIVNAAVVADARAAQVLVNDAADAARGDFATPAVHRAGSLTVAVDSGGLSPSFTRRVRDELAVQFDSRYARAARTLGALRERVTAVVPEALRAPVMRHLAERDIDDLAAMPPGAIEHEVERTADTVAGVRPAEGTPLVCATRASKLAMTQSRAVMAKLAAGGTASTVLEVTTTGDAVQDRAIAAIGTDNVFVKELEHALRERRADYAVHSCKDLASTLPDDMTIAAITVREDPRDAFCSERYASFEALPPGARVGTSSPRRRAQLRAARADLVYDDVRGNVDTRLRKLREGQYDAIVLACAGLNRLGARATHTVPFAPEAVTPAAGQGALAIEVRAGDALAAALRTILEDAPSALAVRAERAFLRTVRGGCEAPIGAHGVYADGTLRFVAAIAAADGSRVLRATREAVLAPGDIDGAEAMAAQLAGEMLANGGRALLADGPLAGRLVLLPRTQDRPSRIAPPLRDAGAEVIEAPSAETARAALAGRTPSAIIFPSSGSVDAVAEYLADLRSAGARPLIAAMGPASASAAAARGWRADATAPDAEVGAFVQTVTRLLLENGS